MSTNITLKGSFTFNPVVDTYIKTAGGSPPPAVPANGLSKPINLYNKIISWETSVPPYLDGQTLAQLYSLNISPITYSLSGIFGIEAGTKGGTENEGVPVINVSLLAANRTVLLSFDIATLVQGDFSDVDCGPGDGPGGTGPPCIPFCINDNSPCPKTPPQPLSLAEVSNIAILQLIPWNQCGLPGCENRDASGVTFSITINITLVITCGGENLNTGFCQAYCYNSPSTPTKNFGVCFDPYISYCFNSKTNYIGSKTACYEFFENYINDKNGPGVSTEIDNKLSTYCKKYSGISDLLAKGNPTDQDLYACNLNPTQYKNLENSIFVAFPDYANVTGITSPCLLPECISSPFKTIVTKDQKSDNKGGSCPLPACVSISEINNSGKIIGNINQTNNSKCAKVYGNKGTGGTGSDGSDEESFWDKYKWIIIIGGIIFFLLLILGVVFFVSSEHH